MMMKIGVITKEMIPHGPKNKVMSVIFQKLLWMHDLHNSPFKVFGKRRTSAPMFWRNSTRLVGAWIPHI
jgi:hypothetical protein